MKTTNYSRKFSEKSLWSKIGRYGTAAGREVIEKVLVLFYTMRDKRTPTWAKGVIAGALGYFIVPLDAIADFVPFAGYADDLGALAAAVATVAAHIRKEHVTAARDTLRRWLGNEGKPSIES